MAGLDFLKESTPKRLRREIQNIIDSYSHPWDVLAELCQNSVDAIAKHRELNPKDARSAYSIEISINQDTRTLRIRDDGVGIDQDLLTDLLAPHGTDKDSDPSQIGEKGVGLTYTIFLTNNYTISSRTTKNHFRGVINYASDWVSGKSDTTPTFEITESGSDVATPAQTFTEISLTLAGSEATGDNIISDPLADIEFVLRSRTAIGNTKYLFAPGQTLPINVTLELIDSAGVRVSHSIVPKFYTPEEGIEAADLIRLSDYMEKAALLSDEQKSRLLRQKAIVHSGKATLSGRQIDFYGLFSPSRKLFDRLAEKLGLIQDEESESTLLRGGIYVATKGMPTGIELGPPQGGSAGYWPNFYILIEDDSLKLDLGRKSLPGRLVGSLRKIAKVEIFDKIRPLAQFVGPDPDIRPPFIGALQNQMKSEEFARLKKLSDIGYEPLAFRKDPDNQEAAVVAIFHELVGMGILSDYFPYASGHKATYDLWCTYRARRKEVGSQYSAYFDKAETRDLDIVIEFKYDAKSLLTDLNDNRKYFSDIDLVVCWKLDQAKLREDSVTVKQVPAGSRLFKGSNYEIEMPGAWNLGDTGRKPVIVLSDFLREIVS